MKRATAEAEKNGQPNNISIHALVKRATTAAVYKEMHKIYFNPRPREEGDKNSSKIMKSPFDFNPRPREEGDVVLSVPVCVSSIISIHALVKRATLSLSAINPFVNHFNPRPREEGDFQNLI